MNAKTSSLPCYCAPGPRRCDTLGEHCDRGSVSAEPTAEQWQAAMTACGHEGWLVERTTPTEYRRVVAVARALAAAVTAERDKYLRVAVELDEFATETRNQAPAESGLLRANTTGWAAASSAAAGCIREVT